MKTISVIAAIFGTFLLGACMSPETTSRFDGGPTQLYMMSASEPEELHQSLAAVSMKNALPADQPIYISDRARAIIAAHARH
jgi:hypothetical protein